MVWAASSYHTLNPILLLFCTYATGMDTTHRVSVITKSIKAFTCKKYFWFWHIIHYSECSLLSGLCMRKTKNVPGMWFLQAKNTACDVFFFVFYLVSVCIFFCSKWNTCMRPAGGGGGRGMSNKFSGTRYDLRVHVSSAVHSQACIGFLRTRPLFSPRPASACLVLVQWKTRGSRRKKQESTTRRQADILLTLILQDLRHATFDIRRTDWQPEGGISDCNYCCMQLASLHAIMYKVLLIPLLLIAEMIATIWSCISILHAFRRPNLAHWRRQQAVCRQRSEVERDWYCCATAAGMLAYVMHREDWRF